MRRLLVLGLVLTAGLGSLAATCDPTPENPFVHYCDPPTTLCASGEELILHGGTGYGTYDNPAAEVALAAQLHVNTLELVEFQTQHHVYADAVSEATWARVDRNIAAWRAAGKHVILNLSEFAWSLLAKAPPANPLTTDNGWQLYLASIANRTNTVSGIKYKNDPTIAMVEIWGEACFPDEVDGRCPASVTTSASYSTANMRAFFSDAMANWHDQAPNILVSSGGFSHLDNADNPVGVANGIPYRQIYADANNAACAVEVNSSGDRDISVPKVRSYCQSIGKPWFLAAWSSCYDSDYWEGSHWGDGQMAAHARQMYGLSNRSAYRALGASFWNMRDEGRVPGVCGIAPGPFPLTAQVVVDEAP